MKQVGTSLNTVYIKQVYDIRLIRESISTR